LAVFNGKMVGSSELKWTRKHKDRTAFLVAFWWKWVLKVSNLLKHKKSCVVESATAYSTLVFFVVTYIFQQHEITNQNINLTSPWYEPL